jgi:prophage regulatory protein
MTVILLKLADVKARTSLSRSMIYQLIARGDFPQPAALTKNRVAWSSEAVDAWVAERLSRGWRRP